MKHIKLFEQFINESENTYPNVFVDSNGKPLVAGKKYFSTGFNEVLIPSFETYTVILKVDGKNSMYEMTPSDFKANFKGKRNQLKLQESYRRSVNEGKLNPAEIKKALKEAGALMNTTYNHNRNDQDNMSDAVQDMIDAQNQGVEDPEIDAWLDKYGSNY
jgi:hypothetical protein